MVALAQDSRARIDALLGRRTLARSEIDDTFSRISTDIKRPSIDYDIDSGRRGSEARSYGRRESSDSIRSRSSDLDRRESVDIDRRGLSGVERRTSSNDTAEQRTPTQSERITINTMSPMTVEVGSVTLSNTEIDMKPEPVTITAKVSKEPQNNEPPTPKGPPVVAKKPIKKPPSLAKSPFKFGTVSLQVKLED